MSGLELFVVLACLVGGPTGPDLTVDDITSTRSWGTADGRNAYSLGVRACNLGDARVAWDAVTPAHPVIVQNMYRLANGRLEQIGMSWAAHEFCALQMLCTECDPAPACNELGVGCADVSSSAIMGALFGFGRRSDVNAATGVFPIPYSMPDGDDPPVLLGRLLVHNEDLDPAGNDDALYYVELLYVAADDAAATNTSNNASWRQVTVQAGGNDIFPLALVGTTHRYEPALAAWATVDPEVTLTEVDVPGDGRFIIGTRVSEIEDGLYEYEYAVFNQDSHRGAGAVEIDVAPNGTVSSTGFHDVEYHSGEPIDGTDWTVSQDTGSVRWATETFDKNPNANALRWGTLYNVRLVANVPPSPTAVTLTLFRPVASSGDDSVTIILPGPGGCAGDTNFDSTVNVQDLLAVLGAWGSCPGDPCPADVDGSGVVDVLDLLLVLVEWGPCG